MNHAIVNFVPTMATAEGSSQTLRHIPCCSCHRRSSPFFLPVFPSPRLEHYYKNIGSSSHENASPAVLSRQTESRNGEVSARFLRMNGGMWNWIHVVRPSVGTASSYNLGARASWKNIWNTCTVTSSRRLIHRLAADLMIMINQINTTGHVICLYWEAWAILTRH